MPIYGHRPLKKPIRSTRNISEILLRGDFLWFVACCKCSNCFKKVYYSVKKVIIFFRLFNGNLVHRSLKLTVLCWFFSSQNAGPITLILAGMSKLKQWTFMRVEAVLSAMPKCPGVPLQVLLKSD